MVRSIIYRTLGKHNNNEDIAQQVFANFYFSIGAFDHRCSLLTWIHRLTLNECYSDRRKKRVRKLVYESDFSAEESFGKAGTRAVVDLQPRADVGIVKRDLIETLLDSLSDNERRLLLLEEAVGYSIEELSRMTSTSENTLKVKLFRVRRKLAKSGTTRHNTPADSFLQRAWRTCYAFEAASIRMLFEKLKASR